MLTRWLLLDLETVGGPDAEEWLPPVEQDKRFTDPAKIAADIAEKRAKQLASAALDADLCKIVCAGWHRDDDISRVFFVPNEDAEREVLNMIWAQIGPTRPMLGYGLSWFDAGVLVRRSQLLDVRVPPLMYQQGKYRHPAIVELADYLTLNGMIEQKKGRGLDYHCKRLGIQVEDAHTGKDVAELYAAGNVEGIKSHCQADITRVRLLAERLRVIPVRPEKSIQVEPEVAEIF